MSQRILFLSQTLPPRPAAGARRLRHLTEAALKSYDRVFAIRLDRDYPGQELPGVHVTVIKGKDLRSYAGGHSAAGTTDKSREPGWKKGLRRLRQSFPFVLLTDDGGPHFRRAAFRLACQLIEKERVTTILTSFRPWSDHLIAKRLKKKFPHLHWIADFRDLPVDPVRRDVWWPGLQTWWGKRVIAGADEVWCVSQGQEAHLTGWHPVIKVKYNALLSLPPERSAPVTGRFTIVYTGSVYPGLQSIQPLVQALQNLLADGTIPSYKLLIVYRGKDAGVFRSWTTGLPVDSLDIQPSIAPAAAQNLQREAQVLLLLNWSAPNYYGVLTAKLWDYLAAGRPILALVNGPGDEELQEIILGADAGAVFGEGKQDQLKNWLAQTYQRWSVDRSLTHASDREFLQKYLPAGNNFAGADGF